MKIIERINKVGTKHLYEVEVSQGVVQVEANTRAQAAKIAEAKGYTVRSVNMVG